jgi:hypothetical protein
VLVVASLPLASIRHGTGSIPWACHRYITRAAAILASPTWDLGHASLGNVLHGQPSHGRPVETDFRKAMTFVLSSVDARPPYGFMPYNMRDTRGGLCRNLL